MRALALSLLLTLCPLAHAQDAKPVELAGTCFDGYESRMHRLKFERVLNMVRLRATGARVVRGGPPPLPPETQKKLDAAVDGQLAKERQIWAEACAKKMTPEALAACATFYDSDAGKAFVAAKSRAGALMKDGAKVPPARAKKTEQVRAMCAADGHTKTLDQATAAYAALMTDDQVASTLAFLKTAEFASLEATAAALRRELMRPLGQSRSPFIRGTVMPLLQAAKK